MPAHDDAYTRFYKSVDRERTYYSEPWKLAAAKGILDYFVDRYHPPDGRILEIGSGKGVFQNIARDYTGIDIADSLKGYYHEGKCYVVVTDGLPYPFRDGSFNTAFTLATFEHIPSLEHALEELLRVVRTSGYILFHAAWQVRPWVSKEYLTHKYSELSFVQKLEKLSIMIRDSVLWRSMFIVPTRLWRTVRFLVWKSSKARPWRLRYRRLTANYTAFLQDDSDACNHIDIHEVVLWFMSRGCHIAEHFTFNKGLLWENTGMWKAFRLRTGCFVVNKCSQH